MSDITDEYDQREPPAPITLLPRRHLEEGEKVTRTTPEEAPSVSPSPSDASVVEIGEMRLRLVRSYEKTPEESCKHNHTSLDDEGDIVRCDECGMQVSAYWVLKNLAQHYKHQLRLLQHARETVAWERGKHIVRRAARKVEEAWRSRTMAPACPLCGRGILPTDGFGDTQVNKARELERRAQEKQKETP
jgi:hypothetical protein